MFIPWKTSDFDSIEEAIHQLNRLEKCCVNKNEAIINLLAKNNELRYERLIARYRYFYLLAYHYACEGEAKDSKKSKCTRIAEAIEKRAADIKAAETSRNIHEYLDEQNDLMLEVK